MLKTLLDALLPLFVSFLLAVVTAVLTTLRPYVIEFVQAQVKAALARAGSEQRALVARLALEAVNFAERVGEDNEDKQQVALAYVRKGLLGAGVLVPEEDVIPAIEAALGLAKGVLSGVEAGVR